MKDQKKQKGEWDPNDAGLNKDGDPGNYSTGKEDIKNADPEERSAGEESEKKSDTVKKNPVHEQPAVNPGPNKGGG